MLFTNSLNRKKRFLFALLLPVAGLVSSTVDADTIDVDGVSSPGEWSDSGYIFLDDSDLSWLAHRDITEVRITDDNESGTDGNLYLGLTFANDFRESVFGVDIDVYLNLDIDGDGEIGPGDRIIELTDGIIYDSDGTTQLGTIGAMEYDGTFMEAAIPYDELGLSYGNDDIGVNLRTTGASFLGEDHSPENDESGEPTFMGYDGTDPQPLRVRMGEFSARVTEDGVRVEWRTLNEIDNAGFHLFRLAPDLSWTQLTGHPIPGLGNSPVGGVYSYFDPVVDTGDVYAVMDLERTGRTDVHGPAIALPENTQRAPVRAARHLQRTARHLSRVDSDHPSRRWRGFERARRSRGGVVLEVTEAGLQRVPIADLVEAGLSERAAARGRLRVTADGEPVAAVVEDGLLEFHAPRAGDRYADHRAYVVRPGRPAPIRTVRSRRACVHPEDRARTTRVLEEDLIYNVASPTDDPFSWAYSFVGYPARLPLEMPEPAGETATVRIYLAGFPGPAEDRHVVEVRIDDESRGAWEWNGSGEHVVELEVAARPAPTSVEIAVLDPNGLDVVYVDRVEFDYDRSLTIDETQVRVEAAAGSCLELVAFSDSPPTVWDVSNPSRPRALEVVDWTVEPQGGGRARVVVPPRRRAGTRALVIRSPSAGHTPRIRGPFEPDAALRRGITEDYLVLTHPDYLEAADALAEHRRGGGHTARVVTTRRVYDTFGHGQISPAAIRDLLRLPRAPRFVLLLGGASVDSNGVLDGSERDDIPAPFTVHATRGWEAADDGWYVRGEDGAARAAIGRLPVRSPDEAAAVVEKIITWSSRSGAPAGGALLIADEDPETTGEGAFAEQISTLLDVCGAALPQAQTLSLAESSDAAGALGEALSAGVDLVSYHGHGYTSGWSSPPVLTAAGAAGLDNEHLFIALSWTCFDGSFVVPWGDSLIRELVHNPAGGAIAAVASSSLSEPDLAAVLAEEVFCRLVNAEAATLGEALAGAENSLADDPRFADIVNVYNLIGDPATKNPFAAR